MSSAEQGAAAPPSPDALAAALETASAWPFVEARKIVARIARTGQSSVLFETGYGPSGLPHIGTFGEVARTTMVRHAFRVLTGDRIPTRLVAFSDDMDGLRKVPDNIPNKELVAAHLGRPLTQVPDPFGTHDSFGAHNNARLRAFLDAFGFDYEFASATDYYRSGRFDAALRHVLARLDVVLQDHAAELPRGARGNLFAVPAACIRAPASSCRCRSMASTSRPARSPGAIPTPARLFETPGHRAAPASCNGSPTGRCAGWRSASITRWRART